MKDSLVSIIISTHNWEKYIKEAIDSVFSQTFKNFELIIINDCSTDSTDSIIKSYIDKYDNIVYVYNKKNLWLTKSLNLWINKCKWKYIARIDDDDIWCDNKKLEKQIDFLDKNNEYWLVWTSMFVINEKWVIKSTVINREHDKSIRENILSSNQFTHPSVLIRKSALEKVWFYDESFKVAQDGELWLRIWTKYKFHNIKDISVKYRVTKGAISSKKYFKQRFVSIKLLFMYRKFYPNFLKWLFVKIIWLITPRSVFKNLIAIYKRIT